MIWINILWYEAKRLPKRSKSLNFENFHKGKIKLLCTKKKDIYILTRYKRIPIRHHLVSEYALSR